MRYCVETNDLDTTTTQYHSSSISLKSMHPQEHTICTVNVTIDIVITNRLFMLRVVVSHAHAAIHAPGRTRIEHHLIATYQLCF